MDLESLAAKAVNSIQQADDEAQQAQLAFVLGDFENLFKRKAAAARARLEAHYRELNERTKTDAGGAGATSGSEPAVSGSAGSGVGT